MKQLQAGVGHGPYYDPTVEQFLQERPIHCRIHTVIIAIIELDEYLIDTCRWCVDVYHLLT